MSEMVDKGKEVGEKAKALADAGIEKLKGVDWKAQGDKAKAFADAGMAKLKEVDWKAQGASAKEKANAAKEKVIATWRSGNKGKAICIVGALLLVWIGSCIFGGGSEGAKGFTLSGDDLKTESKTDQLFYVKKGKDDGAKEVVPNLKKIPKWVHEGTLAHCLNPHLESDLRIRGKAYLNDPEFVYGSWCVVHHVASDHVIVKPNDPSWSGDYFGYVQTDDDYVEGANLRQGFYAFIGKKTVPLANGSSVTMYAFSAIDRDVSDKVVAALKYNLEATEAAEKENDRRKVEKIKGAEKAKLDEVYKALEKEVKSFEIPSIEKQIHLPSALKKSGIRFECESDHIVVLGRQWTTAERLMNEINEKNWKNLMSRAMYDENYNAETIAKFVVDCHRLATRNVSIRGGDDVRSNYDFISVNPIDTDNKGCEKVKTSSQGGVVRFEVKLCEQVYLVDKNDTELLSLTDDKGKFMKAFDKKN